MPRFEDLPDPDILIVPGGTGTDDFLDDERLVGWIRQAHETSPVDDLGLHRLAAARRRRRARRPGGHQPLARHRLARALRRRPTGRRVVEQGKVITAAGVVGIDMALVLAAKIGGPELAQAIQLGIEYDPQPPFDSGSVEKAPPEIVELVRAVAAAGPELAAGARMRAMRLTTALALLIPLPSSRRARAPDLSRTRPRRAMSATSAATAPPT